MMGTTTWIGGTRTLSSGWWQHGLREPAEALAHPSGKAQQARHGALTRAAAALARAVRG